MNNRIIDFIDKEKINVVDDSKNQSDEEEEMMHKKH